MLRVMRFVLRPTSVTCDMTKRVRRCLVSIMRAMHFGADICRVIRMRMHPGHGASRNRLMLI